MKKENLGSARVLTLRKMTVIGVLGAVSIMLGMTPLGFIPVGPTKATIMHIPVIIGSILEGPVVGTFIGLIFGLFSMFQAITNPTPVSFVFYNPLIAILPRVAMGFLSYYIYRFFSEKSSKGARIIVNLVLVALIGFLGRSIYTIISENFNAFSLIFNIVLIGILLALIYYINKLSKEVLEITMAAACGTLINTVGVLGGIYLIYGEKYMIKLGKSIELARKFIFGVAITNGIPEVILAIIITVSVVRALKNSK